MVRQAGVKTIQAANKQEKKQAPTKTPTSQRGPQNTEIQICKQQTQELGGKVDKKCRFRLAWVKGKNRIAETQSGTGD